MKFYFAILFILVLSCNQTGNDSTEESELDNKVITEKPIKTTHEKALEIFTLTWKQARIDGLVQELDTAIIMQFTRISKVDPDSALEFAFEFNIKVNNGELFKDTALIIP